MSALYQPPGSAPTPRQKAERFLQVAADFRLGDLPTEQRHPATHQLSTLSLKNLPEAIRILKEIDLGVVQAVEAKAPELARLEAAIEDTFQSGGRVFLYGCGATGRLSISVEYFWKSLHPAQADRVQGFMSGGDLALVHSVENFEDHPEWGARQLREIGFGPNDLLISTTEGGETPSVIGCTEEALLISKRKPFFLYCNPDEALAGIARSRRVLENDRIEKICLFVGPMSLSGSTRLQATTALLLGVCRALLGPDQADIKAFGNFLRRFDFSFLVPFIEEESQIYEDGNYLLYETDDYGITILTDTTERAPTFSLLGFENQTNPERKPSLSYLDLSNTPDSLAAWEKILRRDPIALEWEEMKKIAGRERLLGFDFSRRARAQRKSLVGEAKLAIFRIVSEGEHAIGFSLNAHEFTAKLGPLSLPQRHLFLKLALNMHSLLVMGRRGRFESNVMTWVKPSNNKLVDRAVRYVQFLLESDPAARVFSYEEIAYQLFEEAEGLWGNESVVLKTAASLKARA